MSYRDTSGRRGKENLGSNIQRPRRPHPRAPSRQQAETVDLRRVADLARPLVYCDGRLAVAVPVGLAHVAVGSSWGCLWGIRPWHSEAGLSNAGLLCDRHGYSAAVAAAQVRRVFGREPVSLGPERQDYQVTMTLHRKPAANRVKPKPIVLGHCPGCDAVLMSTMGKLGFPETETWRECGRLPPAVLTVKEELQCRIAFSEAAGKGVPKPLEPYLVRHRREYESAALTTKEYAFVNEAMQGAVEVPCARGVGKEALRTWGLLHQCPAAYRRLQRRQQP